MGRNMAVLILDEAGKERATHRVTYGSRIFVDDGDKVKRGQRIAEWDPYTRPILTEVEGKVAFEDLVDGISVQETADESTGITKREVIDWRSTPRGSDLKPAIDHPRRQGQGRQAVEGRRRPLPALGRGDPLGRAGREGAAGRRDRAYPDGKRQDQGHHRRSAAGGRTVRGTPSEGSRHHRRDRRHDPLRPRLQEQAPHHHRAA